MIPEDSDDRGKEDGDMDGFVEDSSDVELQRAARLEEESKSVNFKLKVSLFHGVKHWHAIK